MSDRWRILIVHAHGHSIPISPFATNATAHGWSTGPVPMEVARFSSYKEAEGCAARLRTKHAGAPYMFFPVEADDE